MLCKFNSLSSKCGDTADAKHPTGENEPYLIPRTPNAWTVFSTSQVYSLSNTPQCSRFLPADTSSHLMGEHFKTSPYSYIVRTTLSLKLLRQKHVYLHLSKHWGKTTAPWRKLMPQNLLKCYKLLTTRVNRCTNKDKQPLVPNPRRELAACPPSTQVSGRWVLRAWCVVATGWLMPRSQHSPGTQTSRYQKLFCSSSPCHHSTSFPLIQLHPRKLYHSNGLFPPSGEDVQHSSTILACH